MRKLAVGHLEDIGAECGQTRLSLGLEQRLAEMGLQLFQGHRHRRGRAAQGLCRADQIAGAGDLDEDAEHLCFDHFSFSEINFNSF